MRVYILIKHVQIFFVLYKLTVVDILKKFANIDFKLDILRTYGVAC